MLDYLYRQPEPGGVPQGKVLVHNSVRPTTGRPGTRGSRIWTQEPDDRLELWRCDWRPGLGDHYQVKRTP
jgi:hypothetical protein